MRPTRKFEIAVAATAVLALFVVMFGGATALADELPYRAFGAGLRAGQVVEAFNGSTSIAKITVDTSGNWLIDIPTTKAANGDKITFVVDGKVAKESATFQSGQFTPVPGLSLTVTQIPAPGAGRFTAPPNFGNGDVAQVVFAGGTVEQLETAAVTAEADGVWSQDSTGAFQLLIVGGPSFLRDTFSTKFQTGFTGATAVTVVRGTSSSGLHPERPTEPK